MEEKKETGRGTVSCREAGRKGGNATKGKYGTDYYEKIGRKGGATVRRLVERGKRPDTE